jgi:hypothetical protein
MKKYLAWSMVLLFLLSFSYATATPITTPVTLAPTGYPDITVNSAAAISFIANGGPGGGTLIYTGIDEKITFGPGDSDDLDPAQFTLTAFIDGTGSITGGSMYEVLPEGETITLRGTPYTAGPGGLELLRANSVTRMQWDNNGFGGLARFAFEVGPPVSGLLTTDPNVMWSTTYATRIVGGSDEHSWPTVPNGWWNGGDFTLEKAKSDKVPTVPEPTTLLLLGCGLVGMAAYGWRRKKKQS